MPFLDWSVLVFTTVAIIGYGLWKTRAAATSTADYLHGGYVENWRTIGLSVMATQASAITFLSVPGQGFEDGLRFVQFYFGLPIAMVVISAWFIPIYYRLRVLTAYEYLESRFDLKTRLLAASLFLIQRGLATGVTIYAPAIILSAILGWPLQPTIIGLGVFITFYTVVGGARAVSQTQKQQMIVMLGGIVVAAVVIVLRLPKDVTFSNAVSIAGVHGRMNPVNFGFSLNDRYNVWSGLGGGFFLALSYFGTDQSQVARYLNGKSITESRLGLLFNGALKIPMQALILFIGVLVFVFYQFTPAPILFNEPLAAQVAHSPQAPAWTDLQARWADVQTQKQAHVHAYLAAERADEPIQKEMAKDAMRQNEIAALQLRQDAKTLAKKAVPGAETKDTDYIFITFVTRWLPSGLVGLLLAVILAAAMSSTASELNALGSTTTVDFYRRVIRPQADDREALLASRLSTVAWGIVAVAFASFASLLDNLIQAVNILGSIFYGTVLGIFLVAFALKSIRGPAVFWSAVISQLAVIGLFFASDIGFLWYNVIGCFGVILLASGGQAISRTRVQA
jgi:Na+/proline symporter